MDAFPAFFSLTGKRVVVAGRGEQAEAKARLFAGSPAELVRVTEAGALAPGAFDGALLAFIAGDQAFCEQAAAAARAAGTLVNVVDRPALSDFNTPALVDRGEVVVGIGTAGAAPMMAALLRSELESRIPQGAGRVAALFKKLQDEVREAFPDLTERRAFLRGAFASPAADAAAAGDMTMAERLLRDALAAPHAAAGGRLQLLRGDGPAERLTLKAARALAETDVLALSGEVSDEIVQLARRDAERHPAEVAHLAEIARGKRVTVIVAGPTDPLAEQFSAAGIEVEILPTA